MKFDDFQKQFPRGVLPKGLHENFAKFTGKRLCLIYKGLRNRVNSDKHEKKFHNQVLFVLFMY